MANIFISYSRKDKEDVDKIIDKLEQVGHQVWVDRESIRGGEQWRLEIVEALDSSDAIILVLSENSIKSDNVRKEIDLSGESRKKVIPIDLQPVEIPPSMRYQLAGIQRIDIHTDFNEGFQQLLETLVQPTPGKIDSPRAQPAPMPTRVPRWIPILGIGLALGIILAIVVMKQFTPPPPTAQPTPVSQVSTSPPGIEIVDISEEKTHTPTSTSTVITQEPTLTPTNTMTPSPITVKCPGAVPSQIQVGIQAYICTKSDRVKTFESSIPEGKEIFRLNTGTEFEVVGGPKCAGSSTWWQIKVLQGTTVHYGSDYPLPEDTIVWVQEGSDPTDRYWICPSQPQ